MKLSEVHFRALLHRIRNALEEGKKLVVLGWRDSNHDNGTKKISKEGRVVFCHEAPSNLGSSVGLVVSNKFISHKALQRISVHTEVYSGVLTNGEIKRLLNACADLLHPVAKPLIVKTVVPSKEVETPKLATLTIPVMEKTLTALLDQGPEMEVIVEVQPIIKFAQSFKAEADKNKDGLVGKKTVGKLFREAGLDMNRNSDLVVLGFLESFVSEGSKHVGKYRATNKLRQLVDGWSCIPIPANEPTTDPFTRAELLVAERSQVEEEIASHENAVLGLREKLEKIQKAEELLTQLRDLVK